MAGSVRDVDAELTRIADFAGQDAVAAAASDLDAVSLGCLDDEPSQDDVAGVLQNEDGRRQGRQDGAGPGRLRRRPEVEQTGGTVDADIDAPEAFSHFMIHNFYTKRTHSADD